MIPETKLNILQELINTSSKEEIIWINGYLNGLVSGHGTPATAKPSQPVKKISILYGTETGNSKKLAFQFTTVAKQHALNARCTAVDQYRHEDLVKEGYLFIVISTQGEGEPPEAAKKFYDFLHTTEARLENLKYSILALGDSSYPLFCKTGEDVDAQLQRLGATRVLPVQKCDVDYEQPAEDWFKSVINLLGAGQHALQPVAAVPALSNDVAKKHTKKNIEGVITRSVNLNDKDSTRRTWHIEIRADEDLDYEAGDSIAIVPINRPEVVERIIELGKADPEEQVNLAKSAGTIRELLTGKLNICYLLGSVVKKYAVLSGHEIPEIRMDLVDLLRIYPLKDGTPFAEVLNILHPIAPRLYSVSSSPKMEPREVHITVSLNGFLKQDEQHYGLCSSFLGDLPVDTVVIFYVHRNRSFKLPAPDKDIIMVGPGTGIAPFRGFLQERDVEAAPGRNWLFFGERNFTSDFFYQTEIQQYHETGVLQKVNVAFSRDTDKKIYVQHKMKEHGKDLYNWLEKGAVFYVAGSKVPMSQEVEEALLGIIEEHGGKSERGAKEFLEQMKKEGRYQKDVY
jgi:sulfite reductase (NADPH) flavoprotein alpha-component